MGSDRVYNFSAGPSTMPEWVLETAAAEMLNYKGSGMSVMEMSHRSSVYQEIFQQTKADVRELLNVPDSHEILFLQGGASLQFSMVPLNLLAPGEQADYAVTGNFASIAAREATKYGHVNIAADTTGTNHSTIPAQGELKLSPEAKYFYYCANNTIYGTEWHYVPETGGVPLVADMSSNIMTQPVDFSKYAIVFAGAQKNMGPAGVTMVIIRRDLAGRAQPGTPLMLDYKTMIDGDSMYNTPPSYSIYLLGLMMKWLKAQGGVAAMESMKKEKSALLYDTIDNSSLFRGCAQKEARSYMNVTFTTGDPELDGKFCAQAAAAGFVNVKGHRKAGGMRASIYNAQSMEGVKLLRDFMKQFEVDNHG